MMNMRTRKHIWMAVAICLGILLFSAPSIYADSVAAENDRIECGGFDTPEEAITAFCEALKENDIEKAVSTFAIESYCDNFDYAGQLQRMAVIQNIFNPAAGNIISPAENGTLAAFNPELRAGNVVQRIYSPLLMAALDNMSLSEDEFLQETVDALRENQFVTVKDQTYSELQSVVAAVQQFPDFSAMKISEPISPIAFGMFSSNYLSLNNLNNIAINALINGASGVTELGVIMEDDVNIYLVSMNIVKYGDKWFNCTFGGNIMVLMNIESYRQGLVGGPKEQLGTEVKNLLAYNTAAGIQSLLKELIPEYAEFRSTFEEEHAQYIEQLQNEAEANGLTYDPEIPWLEQLDVVRELAEKKGERFYSKDYVSITAMSYEEMLAFFSVEELA